MGRIKMAEVESLCVILTRRLTGKYNQQGNYKKKRLISKDYSQNKTEKFHLSRDNLSTNIKTRKAC